MGLPHGSGRALQHSRLLPPVRHEAGRQDPGSDRISHGAEHVAAGAQARPAQPTDLRHPRSLERPSRYKIPDRACEALPHVRDRPGSGLLRARSPGLRARRIVSLRQSEGAGARDVPRAGRFLSRRRHAPVDRENHDRARDSSSGGPSRRGTTRPRTPPTCRWNSGPSRRRPSRPEDPAPFHPHSRATESKSTSVPGVTCWRPART